MRASELLVETRTCGPVGMVALRGRLDLRDTPAVLDTLSATIERSPLRAAVCDVRELDLPSGPWLLSVFPAALRRAGGWPRANLHLGGPGPALARALRATGTHRHLPVHPDATAAVRAAEREAVTVVRTLTLPGERPSLRAVQAALREDWPRLGIPADPDEALLVGTELVTNAIEHVARPFTVTLATSERRVVLAVTDPAPLRTSRPRFRPAGRGMRLVAGLCPDWGVRLNHPRGKTVWAALPAAPPLPPVVPPPRDRR